MKDLLHRHRLDQSQIAGAPIHAFDLKDKLGQLTQSRTINFEFETVHRHYLLADNRGAPDAINNLLIGCDQLECAILVVSAVDGPSPATKQQLLLLQHLATPNLIVFFNKLDDANYDSELHELVELETTELLTHYGFDS